MGAVAGHETALQHTHACHIDIYPPALIGTAAHISSRHACVCIYAHVNASHMHVAVAPVYSIDLLDYYTHTSVYVSKRSDARDDPHAYTCIKISLPTYGYAHVYTCCAHDYAHVYARFYAYIYTHACTHACTHFCNHVYTTVHTHVYTLRTTGATLSISIGR